ncbi:MAG TPA: hypothetical protein VNP20_22010 [Nocardioidaceae bacterium]|nr:hypothetical protein [Nocardioidaceae bacterium]
MFPIATEIAVRVTRDHAQSALPDAPVIDDTVAPPRPRHERRIRVARALRRLADRLEPAVIERPQPSRGTAGSC